MPLAGQILRAADFPDTAFVEVATNFEDFSTTAGVWTPTSTPLETTFVANTFGKAEVMIWGRWDSDIADEQIGVSVEVREDDSSGTVFQSPTVNNGISDPHPAETNAAKSEPGPIYLEGLTPYQTYWIQAVYDTNGGNMDIFHQAMWVKPLT